MFFLSRLSGGDIFLDPPASDFKGLVFFLLKNSRLTRKKEAFDAVVAREELGATAVGHGVALPHCRLKGLSNFTVKFVLFREKPGYVTPTGEEVRFVFLVVGPEEARSDYLQYMSHIVQVMNIPKVRQELLGAKNKAEVKDILSRYSREEEGKRV